MKIPKQLKIGGHDIKIVMKDDWGDDTEMGKTDMSKGEIYLNKNIKCQSQLEATLIHEIFHALNTTFNHELLASLSEQFYQVLKDNNLLV